MREGLGVAQVLAQAHGSANRRHLGEIVTILANAIVRFWSEGDNAAAVRAYSALGAFLQRDRGDGCSVIAPTDDPNE